MDYRDGPPLLRDGTRGDELELVLERVNVVGSILDGISRDNVLAFMSQIDAGYDCLNDDARRWDKATWGYLFDADGAIIPTELDKLRSDPKLGQQFKDDRTYLEEWATQWRQWKVFGELYTTEGWWSRNFPGAGKSDSGTWAQIVTFRDDLVKWRADMSKKLGPRGFKLTCGEPSETPKVKGPIDSVTEQVKNALPDVPWTGILVVAGLAAAGYALSAAGKGG
jgi:hypothetical protein